MPPRRLTTHRRGLRRPTSSDRLAGGSRHACRITGFSSWHCLDDSVPIRVGLTGIAVGGRDIWSCDGKARDHRRRRVSVGNGGAPRRRQVDAGVGGRGMESKDGFIRYCRRGRDPRVVAGGGRHTSFLVGRDMRGREGEGGVREASGARFFVSGFDWRRQQ